MLGLKIFGMHQAFFSIHCRHMSGSGTPLVCILYGMHPGLAVLLSSYYSCQFSYYRDASLPVLIMMNSSLHMNLIAESPKEGCGHRRFSPPLPRTPSRIDSNCVTSLDG